MDRQTQRAYDGAVYGIELLGEEINRLESELSDLHSKHEELQEKYNDLLKEASNGNN